MLSSLPRTVIKKHPAEEIRFTHDFTTQIPSGDTATTGETVTAINSAGDTAGAGMTDTSITISVSRSTNVLTITFNDGTDWQDYTVTATLMTTASLELQKKFEVRVRA